MPSTILSLYQLHINRNALYFVGVITVAKSGDGLSFRRMLGNMKGLSANGDYPTTGQGLALFLGPRNLSLQKRECLLVQLV